MSIELLTILLFALLILALMTGLPIVFCMGGVAALFILFMKGTKGLSMLSAITFGVMDNFILVAIPLFIFMGIVLQNSGLAESLYEVMYKWFGSVRGGLAVGTIVICMMFAAMTGVSGAATVSMGVIALPSMLRYKYDKKIAIGCVSAGGTLGILIPPSVPMIVYGVFTGESIGALYAAGVLPGVLLGSYFILYVLIRCYIQPEIGPSVALLERVHWNAKLAALQKVILPVLLIVIVLGLMFAGVATPTEAASLGAIGSLVCAAVMGKLTWGVLVKACNETLKLSCMVLWIVVGGSCFSAVYTAVGAMDLIKEVVSTLPVSPYVLLIGTQVILLLLGCLMDPGGIIMICTPIMVPVIKLLGFDAVWFGVLFIMNMELGYLTPPFGFNLFYMKAIVPPSISMRDIYESIFPFVGLVALCIGTLVLFPQIALWLPRLIIK